ncbi:unnamed protein product [Spirodela intermedia]|uniref:Uncharacterized protein n=1 Tax=Spirodela intermedia TaxID=51605 RepID=A0A7I8J5V0_SPIIN|nr:unnamed protein product [Spirodela intermedia]CAA6665145.1 unnamed protein product [Spirodela intermedia]
MERAGEGAAREVGGGGGGGGRGAPQQKERHVVSWSQQEDDLLRAQVGIHGIENWTSIAAQFKDKTGRQCRRRWFTYLNTECKKGGWSPEEDALLCEAQKIFGNRWTEIAKVVSGRTDNAVKNRFNTLCKKRLKQEAMTKENTHCAYLGSTGASPARSLSPVSLSSYQMASLKENQGSPGGNAMGAEYRRPPLAILGQNHGDDNLRDVGTGASEMKIHGAFLRRNDPKVSALLQQAELLSSLAIRVHTDSTDRCLDSAWKELKNYLTQNGVREPEKSESTQLDFLLDDFKDLIEDLRSGSTGSSPSVSNHSDGQISQSTRRRLEATPRASLKRGGERRRTTTTTATLEIVCSLSNPAFDSPLPTIPLFSPFPVGIPSPNFSASERRFLLSVFGSSSSFPNAGSPNQKPPACKRALLDSL